MKVENLAMDISYMENDARLGMTSLLIWICVLNIHTAKKNAPHTEKYKLRGIEHDQAYHLWMMQRHIHNIQLYPKQQ